jgi:protein-disulfide isomerase
MAYKSLTDAYLLPSVVTLALLLCWTVTTAQDIRLVTLEGEKALLAAPGTDVAGAPNADVTIIEFFDYNCIYCKKLAPELQDLLAQDHTIAIVYKEWPILGEVSVYAARSAIAARWQKKYLIAHDALIHGPRLAQAAQVDAILESVGVNLTTLRKDRITHSAEIDALLARNDTEAHALSLRGTPGIVVGRQLLPGIVELSDLKQLVENARREK